jgi:ubiquitin-like protein Pup
MAERVRKQRATGGRESAVETEAPAKVDRDVVEITDDFLDEIDGVLEENAAEFVAQYVQKGGE